MNNEVQEEVSVSLVFDETSKQSMPKFLEWRGRVYKITQLGLHHISRLGRTLIHHFSVSDGNTFFRLSFNTDNLHWKLEEVSQDV